MKGMKSVKKTKKTLALVLSAILCLNLFVLTASAKNLGTGVSATLSIDQMSVSSSDQTVTLTVAMQNSITADGFSGTLYCPEELTLTSISSELPGFGGSDYNLNNGKVYWSEENVENITVSGLLTAVFTIPANTAAGTYEIGIKDVEITSDYGIPYDDAKALTASATLTISAAPVAVTGISLSKSETALTVGASETLTATVSPENANNKNVSWKSDDTAVATVDQNGKVTAVGKGSATITATTEDGKYTATCTVKVSPAPVAANGVTLTPDKTTLNVGEKQTLTATVLPADATNKNVTWVSSDTSVATVENGVVTAVGKGTATITVTTADGGYTATCEVTVKLPVSAVTLNETSTALVVGNTKQLTATVAPANADDSTVTWKSGNTNVATVDQTGKVTAVGVGTTTITATAGGKSATCTVTVTAKPVPIEAIALRDAAVSVGGTIQLEPVFTPADTTQRDVIWTSSDRTTATVDANGRVRGVSEGKVTITVTSTADPSITASCTVTVTKNLSDAGLAAIIGALGNGSLPFNDVTVRDYFYDAVKWAVDRGITSGTSRYTFNPDAPCTRAQVVTFLWRAAGCPQPTSKSNPFTDVRADDYFYDAVLWAVEHGITNGTSAKTFSPDATVTRAQVVTFLWRANGQPTAGNSGFADVSADKYYATAVAWAVFQRITTGTGFGVFSPDAACTRAQIVTFLYRAR